MKPINRYHLAVMTALGLSACTTPTAAIQPQAPVAQVADDEAEGDLREYHRSQHHGGVMQFIAMGLDTVGPGDAARPQVEKLQRDLDGCMAPTAAAQQRLRLAVADGVAAGAVDLARVDALIGKLDVAADGVRACGVAVLNQLHAVLSPVERTELIEKVQAHWEVWREVNSKEEAVGRGSRDRLGSLAREVALTPDQVDRAAAALHVALSGQADRYDRSRVDADVQAFGAAFEGATFDATSTTGFADSHTASHGATRMAIFYETVTPLLTPSQRIELAGHLRARAGQHAAVSSN